jgi:hypothetical protein
MYRSSALCIYCNRCVCISSLVGLHVCIAYLKQSSRESWRQSLAVIIITTNTSIQTDAVPLPVPASLDDQGTESRHDLGYELSISRLSVHKGSCTTASLSLYPSQSVLGNGLSVGQILSCFLSLSIKGSWSFGTPTSESLACSNTLSLCSLHTTYHRQFQYSTQYSST